MDRKQEYQELMIELENIPEEMTQFSAKTKTRARKRKILRTTLMPSGTLLALIIMIMAAVTISPTVAHAFERIPVLRQIAAMVNFSPSLSEAIEHEFIQRIDMEQTIDNITMRVEYVIVDRRQLNIFYTLSSPVYAYLGSRSSILYAEEEVHAPVSIITGQVEIETGAIRQTVVNFFNEQVPDRLIMETWVNVIDAPSMSAMVPVPVPAPTEWVPFEPEIIATFAFMLEFDPSFTQQGEIIYVNQDFVIDGQHLTLTSVEIYPTQMRANFSANPDNTAWLTALRMYAVNEHGNRFDAITNGQTAFGGYYSPMMTTHILHSPFFAESGRITLFIEEAIWLDMDLERTRVDLVSGATERLPEGVSLYEAQRDGQSWHLTFTAERRAENHTHQIFHTNFYDEAGNEHYFSSWSSSMMFSEFADESMLGLFFVQFSLFDFPYDVVYLTPVYSRVVGLSETIELR